MGSTGDVAWAERRELCDLLDEVGPDAPTLSGEWTTFDLAAHLVVRDRDLLGSPGIVLPGPFARLTEARMERAKATGYGAVVATVRRGPALWWRLAPEGVNLNEFFVHHEDVRRGAADTTPRLPDAKRDAALWSWVSKAGRGLARRSPKGLVARTPEGATATLRSGPGTVTIVGLPGEILLFLNGRHGAAHVELEGAPDDIAAVAGAGYGV